MTKLPAFSQFFEEIWGYGPFPWQRMLVERLVDGHWPQVIDLPTATGKTACIDAAIYALAAQADRPVGHRTAPRRIWFVVDRRIVVDEAYERARQIAERLGEVSNGSLKEVADRLRAISGTGRPLAAARLRGGILCDDQWARMPSQPAVISSTVDQLGSRLLFRGYGHSQMAAPIYAGLGAHDSLILLDEAHLSGPFLQTLRYIENYRGEAWAEVPVRTPFAFAILSATPPSREGQGPALDVFPGAQRDQALDHPDLRQRLSASKPAELVPLKMGSKKTDPLPEVAADRASSFVRKDGKQRVAVIVNRVDTAGEIARLVRDKLGDRASVALLTGRLRPYDRDKLAQLWKPYLRASKPDEPVKPVVLVSTQCIEVGADFSFDALVTEAASLDALRQRFGRLNRLGLPGDAPAVILIRDVDTKPEQDDPVYGIAIPECWRVLSELAATVNSDGAERVLVDFGFETLEQRLGEAGDLSRCFAPRPNAPVLLPAHLDLLCQTAPGPIPEPDIQLYLHGTERRSPEAGVVWRADLDPERPELWEETVAMCPPSSAEVLSVSLFRLRKWLAERDHKTAAMSPEADIEGVGDSGDPSHGRVRDTLVWRGRDRSKICRDPSEIGPNDVVVVPAAYRMDGLGQSSEPPGEEPLDLWELARQEAGKVKALRLNRRALRRWLGYEALDGLVILAENPAWDRETLREAIVSVLESWPSSVEGQSVPPKWIWDLLSELRESNKIEAHPDGGLILFAKKSERDRPSEPDLFADDDDLLSASGQDLSIAQHTAMVERAVEKIASRCVGPEFLEALKLAATWHDVGKLDERFQLLLHQGDEVAAASSAASEKPLAKSASVPTSPARRRAIRLASQCPSNFRHEMLSLQLAERYADLAAADNQANLVWHLIASHHGHARPFAPVCADTSPAAVSGTHCGVLIDFAADERRSVIAPHHAASGVSERFWGLTRRYGWWGLAYLEAMFRLGDWYASPLFDPTEQVALAPSPAREDQAFSAKSAAPDNKLVLAGVDGANPLGFLAALGTLVVLHQQGHSGALLGWRRAVTWQPVITGAAVANEDEVSRVIATELAGQVIPADADQQRSVAQREFDAVRNRLKIAREGLKTLRLRGKERHAAIEREVAPLEETARAKRKEWLLALKDAVPRPELAIGKQINCTAEEYRDDHAAGLIEGANFAIREPLDFLAAFASDACIDKYGKVEATPFCFITGSGHQYFLDTVRQLMEFVTRERISAALFQPWTYSDEKLSMRWDPVEDRRYALMDRDPTASDNKSRTEWMANLLAYRALVMFPSAPRRATLATAAWARSEDGPVFTWPLWEQPLSVGSIRSLLALSDLGLPRPDPMILRQRGVFAAFRARRIQVGNPPLHKINFSPARGV
jgi:CRISPR-associated endonuclease/helicase Cas3